jgi:hypothetical protein
MLDHKDIFIPDANARISIANKLGLPYSENMQDWEYEVSDFNRINEFLIEYKKSSSTLAERNSLMEIILDSINSALEEQTDCNLASYMSQVKELLIINKEHHRGTISYWTKNDFAIAKELFKTDYN